MLMESVRKRRTNAELDALKTEVLSLCRQHKPLSVRQLFYLLVTGGHIEKTEKAYKQVIRISGDLRVSGEMPFGWIRDDSRRRMSLSMHKSPAEALRDLADTYCFDYQSMQPVRLEVWCEKETLTGVLWPLCAKYRIDLLPCKGMPSLTYRHEAAMAANADGRPFKVLYVGDSDPTGELIDPTINEFMDEYLKVEWLGIERIAVTDMQRKNLNLPTRPPKETGAKAGRHADIGCVEVEAIPPQILCQILADAIESNLDPEMLERAKREDQAQCETIEAMIESIGGIPEADQSEDRTNQERLIILYSVSESDSTKAIPMDRSHPLFKRFFRDRWSRFEDLFQRSEHSWSQLRQGGQHIMDAYILRKNENCVEIVLRYPN